MGNEVFASHGLTGFGAAKLQHPAVNRRTAEIVVETDDAEGFGSRDVERVGDQRDGGVVDIAELLQQIVQDRQRRARQRPLAIDQRSGQINIKSRSARQLIPPGSDEFMRSGEGQVQIERLEGAIGNSYRMPCLRMLRTGPAAGSAPRRRRAIASRTGCGRAARAARGRSSRGRWCVARPARRARSPACPAARRRKRKSWRGTIADHWPALTCDTRLKIELVSTAGTGFAPTERNTPSMMRRFCMSGVSRHKGASAASRHVT